MRKLILATLALGVAVSAAVAGNPILKLGDPDFLYLADPAAECYNGRVYLYCSHDQADAVGYGEMQDYAIVSTDDMVNWTNHGVVIKPREYSWAHGQMNAPDAAYKDGWYYIYFPYDKTHVGVAKSRNPEGPWEEAVTDKITTIFDPTVFVDDDGQAYIYGNDHKVDIGDKGAHIMGAKLKDNMVELDGEWMRLSEETVAEAVHIFKREGKYHFTARMGRRTGHWVADSPLPTEPYAEYKGLITPEQRDAPAHNSFIEFQGKWYIFYQRGDVNNGTFHRRSACFEEIHFNDDHSIQPITYTLDEGVEVLNPPVSPWAK
ncbi:MAG: family 43 glycosylhydrolase [Rikenellaceae bacterium]